MPVEGTVWYSEVPVQAESCRVYWGTHGCDRPRGHRGPHICNCGQFPYGWEDPTNLWTGFYGEDVELAAVIALVEALDYDED